MRNDKRKRMMRHYGGFSGPETVKSITADIYQLYPNANKELTGRQLGLVMALVSAAYHKGKDENKAQMWAYDGENDWLMGIKGTDLAITMRPNNTFVVCKGQGEEKIYSQEHTKHTI